MHALVIILAILGVAVAFILFKFQKAVRKAKQGQQVLQEMASAYANFRSEGKTVEQAEAAIYEKFSVQLAPYSGMFLANPQRTKITEENPILFEWLTIREMAFSVHFCLGFVPRPLTRHPIINETNRNLSIMDFCRYLSHAISEAEASGMNPPESLKEIVSREDNLVSEAPDSQIYCEWRKSINCVIDVSSFTKID